MDSFYAPGNVVRWEPTAELPELPLSTFSLTWSEDRTLLCSGFYRPNSTGDYKGVIIGFEGVHAFASFDGFSDILLKDGDSIPLSVPVPYGGCWPFVEIEGSLWVKRIIDEHAGMPQNHVFTHWSILAFDQTLHVMTPKSVPPSFKGWIR